VIKIAELKLKILGDLDKLKKDLQKLMKEKFKIGVEGEKADGEGKKQSGLLGLIFKRLLPVGLLFSLKPIADSIKILTGFAAFGFLKILKFLGIIGDNTEEDGIDISKDVSKAIAESTNSITGILEPIQEKALTQAVNLQEKLANVGIDVNNGLIQNANIMRAALEAQGIDTTEFSDAFLLKLGDNAEENKAALDIIDGSVSDLDKAIGGVSAPIEAAVEKEIDNLSNNLLDSNRTTSQDIIDGVDKISTNEIKVLEDQKEEIKSLPEKIGNKIIGAFKSIIDLVKKFAGFLIDTLFKDKKREEKSRELEGAPSVDDAIIKPNGQVIETDPKDTIIATRNPEASMGGNKTFIFNGVTPQQVIDVIKRELGVDVIRSSRF